MKRIIILLFAIVALTHVFADAPLLPPKSYVYYSPNKTYSATVYYKNNDIVFYQGNTKKWNFSGHSPFLYLTDLDEYIVIPYQGSNLVDKNYQKEQIMLSIIYKGKLKFVVRLNDIISDYNKIQKTTSHYHWGYFVGFIDERNFSIVTVENNQIIIDVVDGSITVTPLADD